MTPTTDISTLSPVQRWSRAIRALARVVANPEETDQVLEFSNYANAGSMPDRLDRFFEDPAGAKLYAEKRAIDSRTIDLDALAALPAGTLGHAYAQFLRSRGFTPGVFDGPPPNVSDPRTSYVIQRVRQTHDLWHVVTGYETDAPSETALQAFTYGQVRAPSSLVLALGGTLRSVRHKPTLALHALRGFVVGAHAKKLAAFPWEDHWS
ncbi:MAG: Coq4 family protein, partial [Polyangiales bacterium]